MLLDYGNSIQIEPRNEIENSTNEESEFVMVVSLFCCGYSVIYHD